MQTTEWLKPGLYGAACGMIAVAVAGFPWAAGWGAAVLVATPLASALAAPAETRKVGTTLKAAAEDATGSIAKSVEKETDCQKSRRKLWVEGEGWIVRRVATCN